ncbi:septal ring lytic transglycosylase RlpA family protein [Fodinibius salsisoli]|uniref:Probable endolytic peptidoglycan transglycosylase RlpA n=1 Tax=Fodinibius salsisoli TaxID=2820877 RepID=A0ABT3PQP1_9BACT|nr:septal ring lytic transglycosylase RlpA family protein [Fodinibius salsisoli]MCW9708179.1 septal ring lytic transglycosylase RlpA family protein [Fodinibius salsisoli]
MPFKAPQGGMLPPLRPQSLFEPKEFILTYSRIAEVKTPLSEGKASWYGPNFHGRITASGEHFNMRDLTAAHPTLPFNTLVWVENKQNGRAVLVRINDRGPYAGDRIIDLSKSAAQRLGMVGHGVSNVQLFIVKKDSEQQHTASDSWPFYTVQLGLFKKGMAAFKYAEKLEGSRVEILNEHNQKYYGVFFGRYTDRKKALKKKEELARKEFTGLVRQLEAG